MTGRPVKHSLTLRGHRTSVSLEEPFWQAFRELAETQDRAINDLAAEIDEKGAMPRVVEQAGDAVERISKALGKLGL